MCFANHGTQKYDIPTVKLAWPKFPHGRRWISAKNISQVRQAGEESLHCFSDNLNVEKSINTSPNREKLDATSVIST